MRTIGLQKLFLSFFVTECDCVACDDSQVEDSQYSGTSFLNEEKGFEVLMEEEPQTEMEVDTQYDEEYEDEDEQENEENEEHPDNEEESDFISEQGADADTDADSLFDHEDNLPTMEEEIVNATTLTTEMGNPHQPSDGIGFHAREEMLPFDEIYDESNLNYLRNDPFGLYALHNHAISAIHVDDYLEKPALGNVITASDIKSVANELCDAFHLKHIPFRYTRAVPNAAYFSGFFSHSPIDDAILFNPDYVQTCINELGSTDIVISDLAHEMGHYLTQMKIGGQQTYLSEKLADFISGFVCRKFNLDIDVARKWFQMYYDPNGAGGYPRSEERWDIQAAGYHYGGHATFDDLGNDLENQHFLDLIEKFSKETSTTLALEESELIRETSNPGKSFDGLEIMDIFKALHLDKNHGRVILVKALQSLKH